MSWYRSQLGCTPRTSDDLALGETRENKWLYPLDVHMQDLEQSGLKQPKPTLMSAFWQAPTNGCSLPAKVID